MIDSPTLIVFIAASLALLLTPGPAVVYIVARSIDQGRNAGLVSAVGVGLGTMFHVVAAALGISALLVSSALAFNLVKYLGAAYLIYLGVRKLLERDSTMHIEAAPAASMTRIFRQGVIVNILNPKTALFFFAFLPQFVDPAYGSVAVQSFMLGTLFVLMGMCSDSLYAIAAGTAAQWLRHNKTVMRVQRYFAGLVFIALGVTTALSGSNNSSSQ